MKPTRRQLIRTALAGAALTVAASARASSKEKTGKQAIWKTVRVSDNSDMRIYAAYPSISNAKAPGILVLQEAFGVNAHIRDVTERLAKAGFVAYAPELYHRTKPGFEGDYGNMDSSMQQMKAMTDAGLEADLRATYDALKADDSVDASRIVSVGYCLGGRASFLANAVLPLAAAVSYYGGRIAPDLLPRAKDQHSPILLFWGGKDEHVGAEAPRQVEDALKAAGKPYASTVFSEAQHGFFCDRRKSYNPEAARESWALFTAFLREHIGELPMMTKAAG